MNIACYVMAWLDEASALYELMMHRSIQSIKENLPGLQDVHVVSIEKGTTRAKWPLFFREWGEQIQRLQKQGHNVLLLGSDSYLVRPCQFDWAPDHFVMPTAIGRCGKYWPKQWKELGRNSHGSLFPGKVSLNWGLWEEVWNNAEATGFAETPWDIDQLALNTMYWAQEDFDLMQDLGYGEFPSHYAGMRGARSTSRSPWKHLFASRAIQKLLNVGASS